jgi:hypothetical protein
VPDTSRTDSHLGEILAELHPIRLVEVGLPPFRTMLTMAYRRTGTWKAAAAAIGVPERTMRDWRSGAHRPSAAGREKVEAYTRETRGPRQPRRVVDPIPGDFKIPFEYNGKGRVQVGEKNLKLRGGTLDRVAVKVREGDLLGAARTFVRGIQDPWYKNRFALYDAAVSRRLAEAAGGAGAGGGGAGGAGGAGGGGAGGAGGEEEEEEDAADAFDDLFTDDVAAEVLDNDYELSLS